MTDGAASLQLSVSGCSSIIFPTLFSHLQYSSLFLLPLSASYHTDVEEITLKAGNFKKFDVFLQMLASSFDNNSESVYVDVLTYSDLEMLKARKSTSTAPEGDENTENKQTKPQTKRYVILTYRGEFDRVHYPLPLAYEDSPNGEALKRTIRRLRKRVEDNEKVPQSEMVGEKDLRKIVASLRQDNTELRHRLRRHGAGGKAEEEHLAGLNRTVADLQNANSKQRKEIEGLKKELLRSDAAYQKLRTESAKEVNRWKAKAMEPRRGAISPAIDRASSGANDRSLTDSLRRKVAELERELRLEKLASSRTSSSYARSPRDGVPPPRRAATPPLSRPRSNRATPTSSHRGPSTFGSGGRGRTGTAQSRSVSPKVQSSGYGRQTSGSRANMYRGPAPSSTNRSRSISPGFGSSVGGRFDPTAYQRQKEEKRQQVLANRAGMLAYSPGSYDSQESPSLRPRRVRSASRSSPSLRNSGSSATKKAMKKSGPSSSSAGARKSASVTSGILSSGGDAQVRRERKIKRSTEKSSKASSGAKSKSTNDVGSFPLPADEVPPPQGAGGPGADLDGSLVEDSPPISKSPVRKSTRAGLESPAKSPSASPNKSREEIQAIDARIASLQEYLDNARTGLLNSAESG